MHGVEELAHIGQARLCAAPFKRMCGCVAQERRNASGDVFGMPARPASESSSASDRAEELPRRAATAGLSGEEDPTPFRAALDRLFGGTDDPATLALLR
jgi:hypothetical protein